jgi:hypothetical protein
MFSNKFRAEKEGTPKTIALLAILSFGALTVAGYH